MREEHHVKWNTKTKLTTKTKQTKQPPTGKVYGLLILYLILLNLSWLSDTCDTLAYINQA